MEFIDNIPKIVAQPAWCQSACTVGALLFLERKKKPERDAGGIDKGRKKEGRGEG
jgi:hypothetical protein